MTAQGRRDSRSAASDGVRRGRRPGAPDTKAAILTAARARFAAQGFAATTMRMIAADAGVDSALVHHYFGSKDQLLVAALELPVDPRHVMALVSQGDLDTVAERFLTAFLSVWDDPALQERLVGLMRTALEPQGLPLLRDNVLPVLIRPVIASLGVDRPDDRLPLMATQSLGLIVVRYLLRLEPLASMPASDVVALYAPTVQRFLTGPLP